MRKPEYISPSALSCYSGNPEEYYKRYLADARCPRDQQTQPMSIGSAFDAFVKSELHGVLFGKNHVDSNQYQKKAIFEAQVESQWRDWAWTNGQYVFDRYVSCGALADLMFDLSKSISDPRFEIEIRGTIESRASGKKLGVPLLGRPDIFFINSEGAHVILDWKVNGYCSNSPVSPQAGYSLIRDGWTYLEGSESRGGDRVMHKDCQPMLYKGLMINGANYLENYNQDWAIQLSTYGWLLGEQVGAEIITGIEQIACNNVKRIKVTKNPQEVAKHLTYDYAGEFPSLRIASHRLRVSEKFQYIAISKYQDLWARITEEPFHFFREMSLEQSQLRCALLDQEARNLYGPDVDDKSKWLGQVSRN